MKEYMMCEVSLQGGFNQIGLRNRMSAMEGLCSCLIHNICITIYWTFLPLPSSFTLGTRIIYDRQFLLECRTSPLARTPPYSLPDIPGVTSPPSKHIINVKAHNGEPLNNNIVAPADKSAGKNVIQSGRKTIYSCLSYYCANNIGNQFVLWKMLFNERKCSDLLEAQCLDNFQVSIFAPYESIACQTLQIGYYIGSVGNKWTHVFLFVKGMMHSLKWTSNWWWNEHSRGMWNNCTYYHDAKEEAQPIPCPDSLQYCHPVFTDVSISCCVLTFNISGVVTVKTAQR